VNQSLGNGASVRTSRRKRAWTADEVVWAILLFAVKTNATMVTSANSEVFHLGELAEKRM
jgi:hypothetical protein